MPPRSRLSAKDRLSLLSDDLQALQDDFEEAFYSSEEIREILGTRFLDRFQARVERMRETTEDLYERFSDSDRRLLNVLRADKTVWTRPTELRDPPRFVPLAERPTAPGGGKTKILSFVNLKGGVGKTTLTANLVAAFASGNYRDAEGRGGRPARVLVVDLDFQGTLSQRCAPTLDLTTAYANDLTSARLLETPRRSTIEFDDLLLPFVGATTAELIPANEKLDGTDVRRLNELTSRSTETRFYFRLWFHRAEIFERFDYVLFDCPPRLTASSVCALLASDFAFVPTAPESFDVNAVIRTINWLGKIRRNLSPFLQFGGAILNRTNNEKGLTPLEEKNKAKIGAFCGDYRELFSNSADSSNPPGLAVELASVLDAHIPRRSGANHIDGTSDAAPLSGATAPFLNRLATEIIRRIQ